MPNISPVPVAPSAPPGPSASSSGAGDTPATNFMDVLTDHQARTDLPEGQAGGDDTPQATSEPVGAIAEGDQQPDAPTDSQDDPAVTASAEALAAALNAVPVAAPVAVSVADTPAVAASATGSAVPTAPAAVVAALAQTAVPADAAQADAAPVAGQPVPTEAAPADVAAAPVQTGPAGAAPPQQGVLGQPVAKPKVPDADAGLPVSTAVPVAGEPVGPQPQQQTAQPQAAPAAAAPAAPQAGADQQQDTGAEPQPQQAPTLGGRDGVIQQAPVHHASTPAQVAPVVHASPLRTAEAVERIHALVHLANANGSAQARMELHPAELGGVTIQLRVTTAGLQAHIAADRPEALPLLQQAGDELRKALADRGVEVSHLDFGMRGEAETGAWRDQGRAQQELADGFGIHLGDDVAEETLTTATVETPAGALVDVKA